MSKKINRKNKDWTIYILECSDKSLYSGITKNLENRIILHKNGKASRYTRCRLPVKLVFCEKNLSHSDALKKEIMIKKFTRKKKIEFINNYKSNVTGK
jgi:putative endonuclease